MGKRWTAAAVVVATMATCASSASAAVEVGNDCVGNGGQTNSTFVQIAQATPGPLPLTVPSAGVVTSWKVRSGITGTFNQRLKVFRSGAAPTQFTAVAESELEAVSQGTNLFKTRIPVQAGDRFGVGGSGLSGAAFLCLNNNGGDQVGGVQGDLPVGAPTKFEPSTEAIVAVSAAVEPDADGDGFGDETQDKCPRSAKVQAVECPLIALSSFGLASRKSALILLASSSSTPITVSATVKVPGKAKKGQKGKAKVLKLNGGAQTVAPGQFGRFVIAYPPRLKAALSALSLKKSLRLEVTASATDATGAPSASSVTLRLKGQAKPE